MIVNSRPASSSSTTTCLIFVLVIITWCHDSNGFLPPTLLHCQPLLKPFIQQAATYPFHQSSLTLLRPAATRLLAVENSFLHDDDERGDYDEEDSQAYDEDGLSIIDQDMQEGRTRPSSKTPRSKVPEGEETVWDNFFEVFVDHKDSPDRYFLKKSIPYYFLRDELGIDEGKMLRISLDHGQVLALSVERSLRPKIKWLIENLRLTRSEAATIIGGSPGLLLLSIEDNLAPKLRWLKDELGLSEESRKRLVLKCPQILTASAGSLLLKMDFFTADLGLSTSQIQQAIIKTPALLILSLDNLIDKIEYLQDEVSMGLQEVGQLLIKFPMFFLQSLDMGLKSKIRFLRRDLNLNNQEISRLILMHPRLFNYNIVGRGRPFLKYLTRHPLNLNRDEVQKLIFKAPELLATDISSPRFVKMIKTLRSSAGMTDDDELSHVVQRFPMILSFTAPRIELTISNLKSLLNCSSTELHSLICKHPQVFGYRPESIAEKLRTIAEIYRLGSLAEMKDAVLKAPALLSYSLSTRIIPRLESAYEAGVSVEKAVSWLPLSNLKFEERVKRQTTVPISLEDTPLLRQRSNAKLRKLLRVPKERG